MAADLVLLVVAVATLWLLWPTMLLRVIMVLLVLVLAAVLTSSSPHRHPPCHRCHHHRWHRHALPLLQRRCCTLDRGAVVGRTAAQSRNGPHRWSCW
jgi:hypothetical protein